jgi:hypothetical protein
MSNPRRTDRATRSALVACALAVACGGPGKGIRTPLSLWETPPADPAPRSMEIPFPDGQNGTQLVVGVLSGVAEIAEVRGVSAFEIQVGPCVRAVTTRPVAGEIAGGPELDRVTFRASEQTFACVRRLVQQLAPPTKTEDGKSKLGGDATIVEQADCTATPIVHVVTRYRFEVDHGFVTPDWDEVSAWSGLPLAFAPPVCGHPPKNELRLTIHTGDLPRPTRADPAPTTPPAERAATIIALADEARRAADAGHPDAAAAAAEGALAAFGTGDVTARLDEATATRLADAIAAAHYAAIEPEAAALLAEPAPATTDAAWAQAIGARIDALARRYERIGDLVRFDPATPWLRAGATRLAAAHRHVAEILDDAKQTTAAAAMRAKAAALDAQAAP